MNPGWLLFDITQLLKVALCFSNFTPQYPPRAAGGEEGLWGVPLTQGLKKGRDSNYGVVMYLLDWWQEAMDFKHELNHVA